MREIVGAASVIDGKAQSISGVRVLGRYRLQIRLTRPVGDFTARLTLPFFCPILSNTPIAEINDPAGSGPYYVYDRVVNQRIVLKRNPFYRGDRPANVDQVVYTISESQEACQLDVEQDRIDQCTFGLSETDVPDPGREVRHQPPRRAVLRQSHALYVVRRVQPRPAARSKAPARSRSRRRSTTQSTGPSWPARSDTWQASATDQLLPPDLARPASIYPLEGADPATARKWLARARPRPDTLVLYATNNSSSVQQAQVLALNLKQIGIDLEVKYFDANVLLAKLATRGEPFDLALVGWFADYADPAAFFVPIVTRGSGMGVNLDDPRVNARIEAANRLTGEARRRAWADLDVDLMRDNPPWAPFLHLQGRTLVSQSLGCFLDHPVYGLDFAAVCKK